MAVTIKHQEHYYTYEHPVGWSGGDPDIRFKLNQTRPAGAYPIPIGEEVAITNALVGALSGGEIVRADTGHFKGGGDIEEGPEDNEKDGRPYSDPDRILDS